MPLVAECPKCGRKGNVPDQFRGRQAKCPGCAHCFTVGESASAAPAANGSPAATPPGTIMAKCPECGFSGRVPEKAKGMKVRCRKCGESFVVGGPRPAPLSSASESSGPAVKVMDVKTSDQAVPEEQDLAPLEEETAAAKGQEAEEAEVVEEADVVEEPQPAKKSSSQSVQPNASADADRSEWSELDEGVDETPRPARKRRRDEDEDEPAEKSKIGALLTVFGGAASLVVIAVVLFVAMRLRNEGSLLADRSPSSEPDPTGQKVPALRPLPPRLTAPKLPVTTLPQRKDVPPPEPKKDVREDPAPPPVKEPEPRPVVDETERVKKLRDALKKAKNGPMRIEVLAELGSLKGQAAPAVPDIAAFLKDADDQVRVAAAESLAAIGPDARAAVQPLIQALDDDFWKVRARSAMALGAIGPAARAAVPRLRQLVQSKDEEVPQRAAEALRKIEGKQK